MRKGQGFLITELIIFIIIGGITLLEIFNFEIFEAFFGYVKEYLSWFIGIGFGYIFSATFKNYFTKLFSRWLLKRREKKEIEISESERMLFPAFLVSFMVLALIVFFIKLVSAFFFTEFFIYSHIIFMLLIIFLYLVFIIENNYELSEKYFVANGIIILINLGLVLYFVA
ncbi:MAG: hypothetical protein AABX44_01855 [Nanoarchaeota archaeon]